MELPLYQIDAFADRPFSGNPAAVVPLDAWLDDALMQAIAEENNLSETAFYVPEGDGFRIRWFTPVSEVDLCGHATLASAFLVFDVLGYGREQVCFESRSGPLYVRREGPRLMMDFPAQPGVPCDPSPALIGGLGVEPEAVFAADDYMAVLSSEEAVAGVKPRYDYLRRLDRRGVIVTAK